MALRKCFKSISLNILLAKKIEGEKMKESIVTCYKQCIHKTKEENGSWNNVVFF